MEMLCGGPASAARKTDYLACLHLIPLLHHVLTLMAIERFQAVGMLDADAVAIAVVRSRGNHLAIEGGINLVVRLGLQIHTRVTAGTSVWTDDTGIRQWICPCLLLYLLQIEQEGVGDGKRVVHLVGVEGHGVIATAAPRFLICFLIVSIILIVLGNGGILATNHLDADAVALLAELHGLSAELMALQFDDGFRVDARTVHHDGEIAIGLSLSGAHDGDGLSGIYRLSHLHQVLGIVGIHGFQTVVMADHDHVAHRFGLARETHITIKHRLHCIALGSRDAHHAVAIDKASLAHRKRE